MVRPIGLYNAPLDQTGLLFRLEVKLLKLAGVLALAAIGVIGGLVLMFLYLFIILDPHLWGQRETLSQVRPKKGVSS